MPITHFTSRTGKTRGKGYWTRTKNFRRSHCLSKPSLCFAENNTLNLHQECLRMYASKNPSFSVGHPVFLVERCLGPHFVTSYLFSADSGKYASGVSILCKENWFMHLPSQRWLHKIHLRLDMECWGCSFTVEHLAIRHKALPIFSINTK